MNEIHEWLLAVFILALIVLALLVGSLVLTGFAAAMLVAMVISVGLDIIVAPFHWISSLFSFPKGRRTREEDER